MGSVSTSGKQNCIYVGVKVPKISNDFTVYTVYAVYAINIQIDVQ